MPMSATQSFGSMHSSNDTADQMLHRFNQIGQSQHQGGGREKQKDSSTKMTLKKARSLFSSSSNKSRSPDFSSPPELPSPPRQGNTQMMRGASTGPYSGGGSAALAHSKSYGSLIGGSNGNSRSPDYRFPGSASNAPDMYIQSRGYGGNQTSPSSQPYSASVALRKASLPNIEHPSRRYNGSSGTAVDPLLGGSSAGQPDPDCPVCLESLSIRLAGEKPHIVPVCGHKLHAECFEAAYGDPVDFGGVDARENLMGSMGRMRKKTRPQGNCAVCRSEMRLGDPAESGKNSK